MVLLGNERFGWRGYSAEQQSAVIRQLRDVLAGEAEDLGSLVGCVHEHRKVDERTGGREVELERGHDAEVPAAATQGPEQVLVLVVGCPEDVVIGGDDVGGDEIGRGQAREPGEPPKTAA
jgi:hypothetical protein